MKIFKIEEVERLALLSLSYFTKIGPQKMKVLRQLFPSYQAIWQASARQLENTGLKPKLITDFIAWRQLFKTEEALKELTQENINFITWHDPAYPDLLREISSPPYVLFYRGSLELLNKVNQPGLAVVGPRKNSPYASKIIDTFLPDLIKAKIIIVSGLALGVDTLAHKITLQKGGLTIAVLGTGLALNVLYPPENISLAKEIVSRGGLLLSEFSPSTPARPQNFPQRNRLISGLCRATLIIEAPQKSGALITAAYALDQNREVLAVPGNIFAYDSSGANNLIKKGAQVITSSNDILEIYGLETQGRESAFKSQKTIPILNSEAEKIIYQLLKDYETRQESLSSDEIAKQSQLDTATINSTLSILELRGIAKNTETGYYIN